MGLDLTERIIVPPPPASAMPVITVAVGATAVIETTVIVTTPPTSSARTATIAPASVATGLSGMIRVGMAVPPTPVKGAILIKLVSPLAIGIPPITIRSSARAPRPPFEPIVFPSPTGRAAGSTATRTGLLAVL